MDEEGSSKRQRNFIARQACEGCRTRKSRCNEDVPCSSCESLGIECIYGSRKATKNEVSLSMIFNTLNRMEGKIEALKVENAYHASHILQDDAIVHARAHLYGEDYLSDGVASNPSPLNAMSASHGATWHSQEFTCGARVSFSAHETLAAVVKSGHIRQHAFTNLVSQEPISAAARELERPPLTFRKTTQTEDRSDILALLNFRAVKQLSDAYFATFNRIYPIVDKEFYFAYTLNHAMQEEMGTIIESCVVLLVMALGCLGKKALEAAGPAEHVASDCPEVRSLLEEAVPGMSLVAESLKRIGFSFCDTSLQKCQYYLLCANFYEQLARPIDEWTMVSHACTAYMLISKQDSTTVDEWQADLHSRLFWACLLRESIITQELGITPSGLHDIEDQIPLPRFVRYSQHRSKPEVTDESYYHYYFLAQIALRIILTRIRNELYLTNPSFSLAEELFLQLEQWRQNLPALLKFSDNGMPLEPQIPSQQVALAMLRTRYQLASYHISRPFLLKALRPEGKLSDNDIRICMKTLSNAMAWPLAEGLCRRLKTFTPARYFACAQVFGQLVLFAALSKSEDHRIKNLVPSGYFERGMDLIKFMSEVASDSPSIAQDILLLSTIYQ